MSRLIDADAFKEYMRKALEETRDFYPDKGEWAEAVTEQFCKDIDDQPTIDPQRKTGRWTKAYDGNDGHVKCTGCFKTYDWISQAQYYNYCPNCGSYNGGDKDDQC